MYSNQLAFDTVLHGMRRQGTFSYRMLRGGGMLQCMYRDEYGNRCAAGMLMNDSWYSPAFEGKRADAICEFIQHGFDMNLVCAMQRIHDDCAADTKYNKDLRQLFQKWEAGMEYIARTFNLRYTPSTPESLERIYVQEPALSSGPDAATYAKGYGIELSTVCELA